MLSEDETAKHDMLAILEQDTNTGEFYLRGHNKLIIG